MELVHSRGSGDRRSDAPYSAGKDVPDWTLVGHRGHAVQFYENDGFLIELLSRYVGSALVAGDSAIVVVTPRHREALENGSDPADSTSAFRWASAATVRWTQRRRSQGSCETGSWIRRCSTKSPARPSRTREPQPVPGAAASSPLARWSRCSGPKAGSTRRSSSKRCGTAWPNLFVLAVLRVPDERLSREPARGAVPEDLRAAHPRLSRRTAPLFRIGLTCTAVSEHHYSGTVEPTF